MPRPWAKFVPRPLNWRWDIVSESFVLYQIRRGLESQSTCQQEIAHLDKDIRSIQDEIVSKWSTANVQAMRAFVDRLQSVKRERVIIERQLKVINDNLAVMQQRGRLRGWML